MEGDIPQENQPVQRHRTVTLGFREEISCKLESLAEILFKGEAEYKFRKEGGAL
jgi:hypothetical protein